MTADHYRRLILRDLDGLRQQIEADENEEDLWTTPGGLSNSPGNLALHIEGNLRLFIGHVLGKIHYERDRDAEFTREGVPKAELVAGLEEAARAVDATLRDFDDARLAGTYPIVLGKAQLNTERFLAHLCTHLAYHLGQVDAHRRITTGQGPIEGMQGLAPLAD